MAGAVWVTGAVMQLWDDLERSSDRVFLIGATNRPADLDAAILRRFGGSFELGLPDHAARVDIFTRLLSQAVDSSEEQLNYELLARRTIGFSPSDITAVCRKAVTTPLDAAVLRSIVEQRPTNESQQQAHRPLRTQVGRI